MKRYYAVFGMYKQELPVYDPSRGNTGVTRTEITWHVIGVFSADKAEEACQAAAKKHGSFGSFFAVEGYPWGIDLLDTSAEEFGGSDSSDSIEKRVKAGLSRLEELEVRSRELERQAGIGDDA